MHSVEALVEFLGRVTARRVVVAHAWAPRGVHDGAPAIIHVDADILGDDTATGLGDLDRLFHGVDHPNLADGDHQ